MSIVLALLLAYQPAAQQETTTAEPPAEPTKSVGKVQVRADRDREQRESTVAKTIFRRDDVVKPGDTNLVDVLKRLPGVSQGRDGGIALRD